jgi:GDPmannose 4,6-dehydratase
MHSVQEFVTESFAFAGLDWRDHVVIDPRYFRPAEVDALQADITRARRILGWEPRTTFRQLVRLMVKAEMDQLTDRAAGVLPRVVFTR